ncbi:MAG TPA: TssQ family T6SS-associated lipoprotein [Burkholderiales bacterium]|nr:TssQ family T6SS-associated lipoprotein [Burkholderiales bacterium]
MRRVLLLCLALLAGCAQFEQLVQRTKAQSTLVDGLRQYDAGDYAASTRTLSAALELGLSDDDRALAHKHLAFIQCSWEQERQCRDEFRKALAADPALDLAPAEAGHPVWGPIFSSMSGNSALKAGLKQYEEGDFASSLKNLQGAIEVGVPVKQRANAHKHLAFIQCSWGQERECRDEFRKALTADPKLQLAPAEAGHPVWGPIFRSLKAAR